MKLFYFCTTLVALSAYSSIIGVSACVCLNRHPQTAFCDANFVFSFTVESSTMFYFDEDTNTMYSPAEYAAYREDSLRNGRSFVLLERRNRYQISDLQFYKGKDLYDSLSLAEDLVSFDLHYSLCGMRLEEGASYAVIVEGTPSTFGNPLSLFRQKYIALHGCGKIFALDDMIENDKQHLIQNLEVHYPSLCQTSSTRCSITETPECWSCASDSTESSCVGVETNELHYICKQASDASCSWVYLPSTNLDGGNDHSETGGLR